MSDNAPKKPMLMIFSKQMLEEMDSVGMREQVLDSYQVVTPKVMVEHLKKHKWTEKERLMLQEVQGRTRDDGSTMVNVPWGRDKTNNLTNRQIQEMMALGLAGSFGTTDVTFGGLNPPGNLDDPDSIHGLTQEVTGRNASVNTRGMLNQMKDRGMMGSGDSNEKWKKLSKYENSKETNFGGFNIKHNLNRAWKKVSGRKTEDSWISRMVKRREMSKKQSVEMSDKGREKQGLSQEL